jgi:gluconate 5-dehydrogenase
MPATFDLTGKVALVTGSSRGLGAAASEALAMAGATLVLSDIDEAGLERQAKAFAAKNWPSASFVLDVTDEKRCLEVIRLTIERFGRIDVLVNNAGIIIRKPAVETTAAEFRHILNVDLVSMFVLSTAASRHMAKNGYGHIINLSSIMGHIGRAGQATYVATKHGVVGLTKSLAAEFGPSGLTVNAIAPGYFLTEINRAILDDQPFVDSVIARTPLRRWAEPDELAGVIVFLASPASSFITGQTILIDGGMTVTVPDPAGLRRSAQSETTTGTSVKAERKYA